MQWEKYGKVWAGLDGAEVVCLIGPAEGAPMEMFTIQFLEGAFTTIEAAKVAAEKAQGESRKSSPTGMNQWLVPALKSVITNLEAMNPSTTATE